MNRRTIRFVAKIGFGLVMAGCAAETNGTLAGGERSDAGSNMDTTVVPAPVPSMGGSPERNAEIGREGGALQAELADGVTMVLDVPAAAVSKPTVFVIVPRPKTKDAIATVALRPWGLAFAKPVTLTLRLPGPPPATGPLVLRYRSGSETAYASLEAQGEHRYVARLAGFGPARPAPVAPGALPYIVPPRSSDPEMDVVAESVTVLLARARKLLDQVVATPTLELAGELAEAIAFVEDGEGLPNFAPEGPRFLGDARELICQRSRAAADRYQALSFASFDFEDYDRETRSVLAWAGILERALPVVGCGPGLSAKQVLVEKAAEFVTRAAEIVERTDVVLGFDEQLDQTLPRFLALARFMTLMGIANVWDSLRPITARLLERMRQEAWSLCRDGGEYYYLGRLLATEETGAEQLSDYDMAALTADIEQCGTRLEAGVRSHDGSLSSFTALGTTGPGQPTPTVKIALASGEALLLRGRLRPLDCAPSTQVSELVENQEKLVL